MEEYQNKTKEYLSYLVARGYNPKSVKLSFDKTEKVSHFVGRKKKNRSMTIIFVIFQTEVNPPLPVVTEIINKHRHSLEADDTLKRLLPRNFIIDGDKRRTNLQIFH